MKFKKLKPGDNFIFRPRDHQECIPLFKKTDGGDAVTHSTGVVMEVEPEQEVLRVDS